MNKDEEIALQLTKIEMEYYKNNRLTSFRVYKDMLKNVRELRLDDKVSKIINLLYEYDHRYDYCQFHKDKLIDDIREVIENE